MIIILVIKNKITKINGNGNWHQVLFSEVIPRDRQYTFSIKIISTKDRRIMIGVVNTSQAQQQSSRNSGQAMGYDGNNGDNNGYKFPGGIK